MPARALWGFGVLSRLSLLIVTAAEGLRLAAQVLISWMEAHFFPTESHPLGPYPSRQEKEELALESGLTVSQARLLPAKAAGKQPQGGVAAGGSEKHVIRVHFGLSARHCRCPEAAAQALPLLRAAAMRGLALAHDGRCRIGSSTTGPGRGSL